MRTPRCRRSIAAPSAARRRPKRHRRPSPTGAGCRHGTRSCRSPRLTARARSSEKPSRRIPARNLPSPNRSTPPPISRPTRSSPTSMLARVGWRSCAWRFSTRTSSHLCIERGAAVTHSTRRDFLLGAGGSLAGIALAALLAEDVPADATEKAASPLAPKAGHLPAKAKRCIFLTMEGGPSHIDTFDPKPALARLHLKEFVREGQTKSAMESGKRYYVQSPFTFRNAGQSGADMTDNWHHLADCADEICFYRGCQVD